MAVAEFHNCKHKKKCKYWQRIPQSRLFICDYLCMEGKSRGCHASECDKFTPVEDYEVYNRGGLRRKRLLLDVLDIEDDTKSEDEILGD